MRVERQDNILRYLVDSRTKVGVQHVVELDLYGGNGGCSCEHFAFRLAPMLKEGATADDFEGDALRCAHIVAARKKLVDDIIRQCARNAALATAPAPRHVAERVPPPRYTGKARKTHPAARSAQR